MARDPRAGEGRAMVCDYFCEATGPVCRARGDRKIVMPTILEEIHFCLTDKFRECVHWQKRHRPTRDAQKDVA